MHKVGTNPEQQVRERETASERAVRRHFQSEPGELCFGYVGEAQLGLEPESGREGGRLGSHILDLCSVSVIPDLVL